jgi:hypothetical protein
MLLRAVGAMRIDKDGSEWPTLFTQTHQYGLALTKCVFNYQ